MRVIACDEGYSGEILAIFNEAILNTTALYDYQPRTPAMMEAWFELKRRQDYPVIGVVDGAGALLGFGTYGRFRDRPAYKYSVEHSLYVAPAYRGRGVGKLLLEQIIARAAGQDYHLLIGGIDSGNEVSIALHRKFGFEFAGRIREAGFKFGRWLDLDFYQLMLETPRRPVDG